MFYTKSSRDFALASRSRLVFCFSLSFKSATVVKRMIRLYLVLSHFSLGKKGGNPKPEPGIHLADLNR